MNPMSASSSFNSYQYYAVLAASVPSPTLSLLSSLSLLL